MDLLPNHRSSKFLSRKHFFVLPPWVDLGHTPGNRDRRCRRANPSERGSQRGMSPIPDYGKTGATDEKALDLFQGAPRIRRKNPKVEYFQEAQATPRRRAALRYRPFIIPMERFTVFRASSSIGNYDCDLLPGKPRRERKADAQ